MSVYSDDVALLIVDVVNKFARELDHVTDFLTIKSNQNVPRPDHAYCDFHIVSAKNIGRVQPTRSTTGDTININRHQQKKITVRLQFYRGLAFEIADHVSQNMVSDYALNKMNDLCISLIDCGDTQDITTALNDKQESRAFFNLQLYVSINNTDNIETVNDLTLEVNSI